MFGTLVYNEILVLPILGFNLYTRAALAERDREEKEEKGLLDRSHHHDHDTSKQDYMATSPHAGYDAQRNQRHIN